MNAPLRADLIEDADIFAALAPEWWDLWRRAPSATPFQSPAWLLPWWRHFHPGELFVATVRDGDRLVGLAPFYIEQGSLSRRVLPVGISLSDYLDVLLDVDYRTAAGELMSDYLASKRSRWDEWNLEELAPPAEALILPAPRDCHEELVPQSPCPVLTLGSEETSILAALPDRHRRTLRLALNRAARRGEVVVERATRATERPMLNVLFRLHRERWHSRGEPGVLADSRAQDFLREAVPGLADADLLRLYVLRIGGEPAAALLGFMHRERAYSYATGFSPEFAFESPGVILLSRVIEEGFVEGAREFHFLRGSEAYKYQAGATDRWNMRRSFRHMGEGRAYA